MKGIDSVYIINNEGSLIFIHENFQRSSGTLRLESLSKLFSLLTSYSLKVGEEDVQLLEMGKSNVYSTRDKITNVQFILEFNKKAKNKLVTKALKIIKNAFVEHFEGNFHKPVEEKAALMDKFVRVIENAIGKGKKVDYFLDAITYSDEIIQSN
jgi:hypothetical protein